MPIKILRLSRTTRAKGHRVRGKSDALLVISVRFDEDTFSQLTTLASNNGCSTSQQIRDLVEIGLEEVCKT